MAVTSVFEVLALEAAWGVSQGQQIYVGKGAAQERPYNAESTFIGMLPEASLYTEEQPLTLNIQVLSA